MSRRGGRPPLQTGGGIQTNTKAPYASVAEEEQAVKRRRQPNSALGAHICRRFSRK